jgi:hypothetical protein
LAATCPPCSFRVWLMFAINSLLPTVGRVLVQQLLLGPGYDQRVHVLLSDGEWRSSKRCGRNAVLHLLLGPRHGQLGTSVAQTTMSWGSSPFPLLSAVRDHSCSSGPVSRSCRPALHSTSQPAHAWTSLPLLPRGALFGGKPFCARHFSQKFAPDASRSMSTNPLCVWWFVVACGVAGCLPM